MFYSANAYPVPKPYALSGGLPDGTVYTVPAGGGPATFVVDGSASKSLFSRDGFSLLNRNSNVAGKGAVAVPMTPAGVPAEPRSVGMITEEAFVTEGPATSPDGRFYLDSSLRPSGDVHIVDLKGILPPRNLTNTVATARATGTRPRAARSAGPSRT